MTVNVPGASKSGVDLVPKELCLSALICLGGQTNTIAFVSPDSELFQGGKTAKRGHSLKTLKGK